MGDMSSSNPGSGTPDRDLGIDLLRGIAILGVVLFHLWGFTVGRFVFPPRHSQLLGEIGDHLQDFALIPALTAAFELAFRSGRDGVSMFLILSGTALTMGALSGGIGDHRAYYARRLSRLMRPYWAGIVVVLLSLLLLAIVKTAIDGGSFRYNWTHVGRAPYFDSDQLIAGILLIPRAFRLEWAFAPPNPLWFVVLILQFYLVFPYVFRFAQHVGINIVLVGSLLVSMASTAGLLLYYDGQLGVHGWITTIWLPFRMFDFVIGMAIGYLLMQRRDETRRFVGGMGMTAVCIVGGIAVYLLGAAIDDDDGYYRILAFPLIAAGLAALALPFLVKVPGRLEVSALGRLLIWIGPMSLAVLIMNEPFRYVDHYLWVKDVSWTPAWWFYITVIYVPGTLIAAALFSRALRLTPAGHPTQLLRDFNAWRRKPMAPARAGYPQAEAPGD